MRRQNPFAARLRGLSPAAPWYGLGDVTCSIDPTTGGRVCTDSGAPNLPSSMQQLTQALIGTRSQSLNNARPAVAIANPMQTPPNSRPFVRVSLPYANFPAQGAAATTILSYTVPVGFNAVINMMAIFTSAGNFTNGSGNIIWRVVLNDASYKNLDQMESAFGTDQLPLPIYIPLVENDTIIVTVEVPAAAAAPPPAGSLTGARFHGYEYPTGSTGQ